MDKGCIIRNIIKEIAKECTQVTGVAVNENFVSYYTNLLILDPKWGISADHMSSRSDVQKFIKFVVEKLSNQSTPNMVTLRMQLYFSCNFDNRVQLMKQNRENLMARISPIKNEILQFSAKSKAAVNELYKKIVYYITLASGLGNPTVEAVFKEAKAALTSVLFEHELREFCAESPHVKEDSLNDYLKLVTGIRLYNRDCKKGGVGMSDLPGLMYNAMQTLNNDVRKTLMKIVEIVNKLTTTMETCYQQVESRGKCYLRLDLPDCLTENDVEYLKSVLLLYRQYELYVRMIADEVEVLEQHTEDTFYNFDATMKKLHDIIQFRIAIPCNQVFPVFRNLHHVWVEIQDQAMLLAKLDQILVNLGLYVKEVKFNPQMLDPVIGNSTPLTDAQRLSSSSSQKIENKDVMAPRVKIRHASSFKDLDRLNIQYLGFCGFTLVETDGCLTPGNPNLGIIRSGGRFYVFCGKKPADNFSREPHRYIALALEMARRKPEYINFLQLTEHLTSVINIPKLIEEVEEEQIYRDISVETDLHPVTEHVDPKYKWNIWDLKREALKLADISKMKTVSTQTILSSNTFNIGLQTYEYRDKENQTKQDNYTNVAKPSIYMLGLRGRIDDQQVMVDLEEPIRPYEPRECEELQREAQEKLEIAEEREKEKEKEKDEALFTFGPVNPTQ